MVGHGHRPHHAGPAWPVLPGHTLGRRTVRQQEADGAGCGLVPEIAANLQRRARQCPPSALDEGQFLWVTARTGPQDNATRHPQYPDRAGLLRRVKGQTQAEGTRSEVVEVVTRGERRRMWSEEQKQLIVAEAMQPGALVT